MNIRTALFKTIAVWIVFFGLLSCSSTELTPTRQSSGGLDTTRFHVKRGDDYLLKKNYAAAHSSYNKAIELESNNVFAKSGSYLASVYLSSDKGNPASIKKNAGKYIEKLMSMKDATGNDAEKIRVLLHLIRAESALKISDNWYERTRRYYDELDDVGGITDEAEFFMAGADVEKFKINQAINRYERILGKNSSYEKEADAKLAVLQKIRRILPVTSFGKNIAFLDSVTRGDMAGLLMIELNIEKLYRESTVNRSTDFKQPKNQQRATFTEQRVQKASDIQGHPMFEVITAVIEYGIRGLEADASGKFYPDQPISRAETAVIIEDILIRVTGQSDLATRYIGEKSPFPDISPDKWFYNAARTVIERQFLNLENKITGEFKPLNPISGVDALLAVKELKNGL